MEEYINQLILIEDRLRENHQTIATMESCTGGGLAYQITNIKGASDILKFSAVTYSNEYKIKMGVSADTIEKYSVYSMEVAKEMSNAISNFANATYGIGITGKMKCPDKENLRGKDNQVFYSIYNSINDTYDTGMIEVTSFNREENKLQVIKNIIIKLEEVTSN